MNQDQYDAIDWRKIKPQAGHQPTDRTSRYKQLRKLLHKMTDGQSVELPVTEQKIKNNIINSIKLCPTLKGSRYVTRSTGSGIRIYKLAKED